jgi:putative IMPACT (imprinted ancient) family translation regulator
LLEPEVVKIEETVYGAEVNLTVLVGVEEISRFTQVITEFTNGQVELQSLGQFWR